MSQGASATAPLMITYPGFDTPDGRSRSPTVDDVLAQIRTGRGVTVNPNIFNAPMALPPGMDHGPASLALIVWEPNPIEAHLERVAERQQQEFLAFLYQLWTVLQEKLRQDALEAKRKEEEDLKRLQEEAERKRKQEELELQRKIEDARKLEELKNTSQALKKELESLHAVSKLNPIVLAGRVTILNPKLDGDTGLEALNAGVRKYIDSIRRLEPRHSKLVAEIQLCPYVYNKLLADIGMAANAIVLGENGGVKLTELEAKFNSEAAAYQLQLERWKAAIDRTKERIAFLPELSRPRPVEAVATLEKLAAQNPFQKNYSDSLVAQNTDLTARVKLIEKTRLKNEETARLIANFIASEAPVHLNRQNYKSLSEPQKSLIRAVRQGEGVGTVEGINAGVSYCWDSKGHEYRGATPPNFRAGRPNAKEYRLYLSTSTHPTNKMAAGVRCGMTGERITSVGVFNTDDMLFFHCNHTPSNGYVYGIITNLPYRRDKTAEKQSYLPTGFPAAPDPVIP